MKQLFRVDRDDLFGLSMRTGNRVPVIFPPGTRGSEHAELLTTSSTLIVSSPGTWKPRILKFQP